MARENDYSAVTHRNGVQHPVALKYASVLRLTEITLQPNAIRAGKGQLAIAQVARNASLNHNIADEPAS